MTKKLNKTGKKKKRKKNDTLESSRLSNILENADAIYFTKH